MTPLLLLTGFLGSGKTTLLKHILHEWSNQKRIAVIQNEFASTGIDGKDLHQTGEDFKLVEINNGSVFCVCQLGSFIDNIKHLLKEYQPDLIVLEASGLADPISIATVLQEAELSSVVKLAGICTIVDGVNIERTLPMMQRVKHQIMIADHLVINKEDLMTNSLEVVKEQLSHINPFARLDSTSYCRIDINKLLIDDVVAGQFAGKEAAGRPDMGTCVLRTHEKISLDGLKDFIDDLIVDCPRIKGFVKLTNDKVVAIQTTFDQVDIKEIANFGGNSEIIAFGYNLDVRRLRTAYKEKIQK
ncbi:hypothetical protein EYV94_11705 [Puteibacter caeruleilacunae]|nr:hypothetical protein EYV94_11705 [Puteibacter caeruleilacunae]